jgi:SAM-dependent methyltransferase
MNRHSPDCYDAPGYWDLAFSDETLYEADFIEAAVSRYLKTGHPRILEVGCGGGRQVVELARRGLEVIAFDLNESCVAWTQRQLKRRRLTAEIFSGDMTCFKLNRPIDLAHCLVNTFRHLLTEKAARQHLECVADSLRPGGIYLLGFHLLPPDAAEEDSERWTIHHRTTRVTTTIRVLNFSRRKRIETVRFSLKITTPKKVVRLSTDHQLRIYRADQFRSLLRSVPAFRLLDVFDFCYDINEPLTLNNDLGDVVFVLRKQ